MNNLLSRIRSINLAPWLAIFYAVGVAGMILPFSRDLFQLLVPFTLLMNVGLLLIYHGPVKGSFWWVAALIYVMGFVLEWIGVNTGLIFGDYAYGETLGPELGHTPLIIGINWLMLVYASLVITGRYLENRYFRITVAAAMMVVYDFALEPSAIYFDMWNWAGGPVPLQNYVAWFVIAFILLYLADRFRMVNRENKIAPALFFIQLVFFILLDIWIFSEKVWELSLR